MTVGYIVDRWYDQSFFDCVPKRLTLCMFVTVAQKESMPMDETLKVMDQFFAPFPAAGFPLDLNKTAIMRILEADLSSMPVSKASLAYNNKLYPGLFRYDPEMHALELETRLLAALRAYFPTGSATKRLYTPYWSTAGYGIPQWAGQKAGYDIREEWCECGA